MAIQLGPQTSNVSAETFHANPPPFRATGKGWYNRLPNFPATERNRSGVFLMGGVADSSVWKRAHLFVTDVSTGWSLTGSTGQSKLGRTFYPMNLHQDAITITGIVANQYEYDRLTAFITHHQEQVATNVNHVLTFKLMPYRLLLNHNADGTIPANPTFRNVSPGMFYEGVVTEFTAGHERFLNAPTWTVNFLVTNDMLSSDPSTDIDINAVIKQKYEKIFGTPYAPTVVDPAVASLGTPQPKADPSDAGASGSLVAPIDSSGSSFWSSLGLWGG